jgi:hypothetical protein
MKRLFEVVVLLLALNFLAVAGGVGYLVKSGRLDKKKFAEVRKLLAPASQPSTQPWAPQADTGDATTQPSVRLDSLLAQASGRSAVDQVEFLHQSFDQEVAQLDRRQRELADVQLQVELAKHQLARDREQLRNDQLALAKQQQQQQQQASDQGFQDSLQLYESMQPRQVKGVWMTLSDDAVEQYLRAMDPKQAAKIIKEFKTPEEADRIQKVLEKIRQPAAPASTGGAPPPDTQPPGVPQASARE